MKTWVIFFIFVGMFLIIQGVFEEKIKAIERNQKVQYKFIPRTYYDEQISDSQTTMSSNMFDKNAPWFDR
jgi:hypothetical protein